MKEPVDSKNDDPLYYNRADWNRKTTNSARKGDGSSNHSSTGDATPDVVHMTSLAVFKATSDNHFILETLGPSEAMDSAPTTNTEEPIRRGSHDQYSKAIKKSREQEIGSSTERQQCNISSSSPSPSKNRVINSIERVLRRKQRLHTRGTAQHVGNEDGGAITAESNSYDGFMRIQYMNPFNALDIDKLSSRHSLESQDVFDPLHDRGEDEAARARLSFLRGMPKTTETTIPKDFKLKRKESMAPCEDGGDAVPTKLHGLCAGADTTLLQLQTELARSPSCVSIRDAQGRLPLHVLGDNDDLISTSVGKDVATTFALQLMRVYPDGITTPDLDGLFPFVSLIRDWQQWSHECHDNEQGSAKVFELLGRVANAVSAGSGRETSGPSVERGTTVTAEESKAMNTDSVDLFPRVELWEEVEWCFEMLSLAMDELGGVNGGLYQTERNSSENKSEKDSESRTLLAKSLPLVMPSIMKTILLVNDGGGEGARKRILQSSIFRALLLQPESVGDWLTAMIRKGGHVSRWAIDYLALLSDTTIDDYIGRFRHGTLRDKEAFQLARLDVFNAVDALDGTVASLVILEEREMERAASTSIIWYIMSKNLARPFLVSLALVDLVLQLVLLLAFRNEVSVSSLTTGQHEVSKDVVYFICIHYFLRKGSESIALFNLSPRVFRSYSLNLWNVFDVLSLIMVLIAYSWNQANPESDQTQFNTLLLGLLWLKILAFLKIVNKEMSTFILSLLRILKDLLYFSIVLLVVILMFSDMFRVAVITFEGGTFCQFENTTDGIPQGPSQDFCNPDLVYSVLRTYALLLGDFELDDYLETPGMTVLFVIFTAIGVIILLNVLIAVISDSYEVAKLNSNRLFGRARVAFVAQNQALESFLKPGANPVAAWNIQSPTKAFVTGLAFLRWGVLLSLIVTATYTGFFLLKQCLITFYTKAYLAFILLLLLVVMLTCALWTLSIFAVGNASLALLPGIFGRMIHTFDGWSRTFSNAIAACLFGISKAESMPYSTANEDTGEDDWQGKISYIEKSFDRSANRIRDELKAEIMAEMKAEIADLKKCLFELNELNRNAQASKSAWTHKVPL